jgi:hypothetical protein
MYLLSLLAGTAYCMFHVRRSHRGSSTGVEAGISGAIDNALPMRWFPAPNPDVIYESNQPLGMFLLLA